MFKQTFNQRLRLHTIAKLLTESHNIITFKKKDTLIDKSSRNTLISKKLESKQKLCTQNTNKHAKTVKQFKKFKSSKSNLFTQFLTHNYKKLGKPHAMQNVVGNGNIGGRNTRCRPNT